MGVSQWSSNVPAQMHAYFHATPSLGSLCSGAAHWAGMDFVGCTWSSCASLCLVLLSPLMSHRFSSCKLSALLTPPQHLPLGEHSCHTCVKLQSAAGTQCLDETRNMEILHPIGGQGRIQRTGHQRGGIQLSG